MGGNFLFTSEGVFEFKRNPPLFILIVMGYNFYGGKSMEESKYFINVGIVPREGEEVLVTRRVHKEVGQGGGVLEWAFPGGKQRVGETREECVKREILAETGYEVEPIKQISLRLHPQTSVIIAYYLCRLVSSKQATPQEPHEIAEIAWVKCAELGRLFTSDIDGKVKQELGIP